MDKKVTGIVSYLTIIGWVIAYCLGDMEGAKVHLNQALILGIIGIVGGVLGIIPFVGWILGSVIGIVVMIFAVIGIIYAAQGQDTKLPIIGDIKLL